MDPIPSWQNRTSDHNATNSGDHVDGIRTIVPQRTPGRLEFQVPTPLDFKRFTTKDRLLVGSGETGTLGIAQYTGALLTTYCYAKSLLKCRPPDRLNVGTMNVVGAIGVCHP